MDDALLDVVLGRIDDGDTLSEAATDLVLAACQGDDALAEALGGSPPPRPSPRPASAVQADPVGAYLTSITVTGFRGVGPEATLRLASGPGLTVVVGRNGSGKSSFAEAIEVLLTGSIDRFEKQAVFRDGWRNLHHPTGSKVVATLHVAGAPGTTTVERRWDDGAALVDGVAAVQLPGEKVTGLDRLGWSADLDTYRPFLAHTEMEAMLGSKPSVLYDRLSAVLGLGDLAAAQERLGSRRRALEATAKAVDADRKALVSELEAVDDERAAACVAALARRPPDIEAAEKAATGTAAPRPGGDLARLRRLAMLDAPAADVLASAAGRLRRAADRLEAVSGGEASRAREIAELLTTALTHHAAHPEEGQCPVCGRPGALDDAWAVGARAEVARLRTESDEADGAHDEARSAVDGAVALVRQAPGVVTELADLVTIGGGDGSPLAEVAAAASELERAWSAWAVALAGDMSRPGGLRALADHLAAGDGLEPLAAAVRQAAGAAIAVLDDRWAPLASRVLGWAGRGRQVEASRPVVKALKEAERWFKDAHDHLRNERLRPIAEEAQEVWRLLRHESNVSLGVMRLAGSNTQRRLELAAQVDGSDGNALGVMSQGEVNALALSIFLPRALLDESPFRFLVIDDPVQAMDPAKVDGLARAIERAADRRQVVVFTHDDRLPSAIRRLGVPATIVQVQRRAGSVVEVHPAADPVQQALRDAMAVAKSTRTPEPVRRRVVPGLCRLALEAALTQSVQRSLLAAGKTHREVEEALVGAQRLTQKAALALVGDAEAGDEVMERVNRLGRRHGDTFMALKRGAHGEVVGDPRTTVDATRSLIDALVPT